MSIPHPEPTCPRSRESLPAPRVCVRRGCVTQLITRGANISFADHSQQTPMQAAAELGLQAISEAMLQYKLAQDEKLLRSMPIDVDVE